MTHMSRLEPPKRAPKGRIPHFRQNRPELQKAGKAQLPTGLQCRYFHGIGSATSLSDDKDNMATSEDS